VLRALEWPMAILALAVVPALILEDRGTTPLVRSTARAVNWAVWLAFAGEFAVRLAIAPEKRALIRRSWFDLLIIVASPPFLVPESLESTRTLRALRLLRLVRAFAVLGIGLRTGRRLLAKQRLTFVASAAVITVGLGAVAVFAVEGGLNRSIQSVGDAFWWSIVTATTVGYGDVSPVTWEGRIIAVVLMLVGIGIIGVFTATVASLFLDQDASSHESAAVNDFNALARRLDGIEQRMDRLIAALEPVTTGPRPPGGGANDSVAPGGRRAESAGVRGADPSQRSAGSADE
jgi:voltage-gated potassium channel